MASSRKLPSAELARSLQGRRVVVGLSGGMDSVVLLHLLKNLPRVSALHVHHGLSSNADAWARFCRRLCKAWGVPLTVRKVEVRKARKGLEAAAREARYAAFAKKKAEVIALAHHLDDQAETVLMNLLRGAGPRGASGMPALAPFQGGLLARPLLDVPRQALVDYARLHGLEWIEDESNADPALTRNFLRHRVGPLLEQRFPQWKRALARAAQHFARKESRAQDLLRAWLREQGLKAPSEAKLVEMLRQLASGSPRTRIEHDGKTFRVYRKSVAIESGRAGDFTPTAWKGERRLKLPALGGELRFTRGEGIDASFIGEKAFEVRLRSGKERLQLHPRRPRRTLKNLFQEAGVPAWERSRVPLLFCGDELVWAAGLGVDVRYRGPGLVPQWRTL
jgi:tRNA(Ile)-lysidine synthase